MASKYGKVSRMFEQDNEGYGINAYNQGCEDPQATNAINTEILTNINALKKPSKFTKDYQKQITDYILRFNRQTFMRIEGTPALDSLLQDDLVVGY